MWRNVTDVVVPAAALNNAVLPLWMIVFGVGLLAVGNRRVCGRLHVRDSVKHAPPVEAVFVTKSNAPFAFVVVVCESSEVDTVAPAAGGPYVPGPAGFAGLTPNVV